MVFIVIIMLIGAGMLLINYKAFSLPQYPEVEEYENEDREAKSYNVSRVIKTVAGLRFLVEEDRPIERIAGIYRPIDIDSYVALKFNKLDKKIDEGFLGLNQRLAELSRRIDALEEERAQASAGNEENPKEIQ